MKTKTSKLWLRSTSRYHDHEAFILCRTALESVEANLAPGEVLRPIIVKLTNSSHAYCGRGAWGEWEHHGPKCQRKATCWRRILVRVGSPDKFPSKVCYHSFKDMPEFEFRTYREGIIGVTAHECGHALGYSGRKDGEMKCELLSWDALDYYRKNQAAIDAEIDAALQETVQRDREVQAAKTPEAKTAKKRANAEAKLKQWKRKLTVAANKVKRYTRMVRRFSKTSEPVLSIVREGLLEQEAEPARLAATSDSNDNT